MASEGKYRHVLSMRIFGVLLGLFILVPGTGHAQDFSKDLKVFLVPQAQAPARSEDAKEAFLPSIEFEDDKNNWHGFYVVIQNVGDTSIPLTMWSIDWYKMVSFEVVDSKGRGVVIQPMGRSFPGNYPSTWLFAPRGAYIKQVNFNSVNWQGIPKVGNDPKLFKIRANVTLAPEGKKKITVKSEFIEALVQD